VLVDVAATGLDTKRDTPAKAQPGISDGSPRPAQRRLTQPHGRSQSRSAIASHSNHPVRLVAASPATTLLAALIVDAA
jgi:hypothetical protein